MAQHCGYVIKIENLRPHPNADRLQLLDVFGTTTQVSLDAKVGDIGIYFPCELQLSEEFCIANHLCRKNPVTGEVDTGYMDEKKRNVTTIKLRGEKSDGIYMPLKTLETFGDITTLSIGNTVDVFNGHEICKKYVPIVKPRGNAGSGNHTRKVTVPVAPLFLEHADTEQLAYNLRDFHQGDIVQISLKIDGTSQRTGYLPVLKGFKKTLLDRLFKREGKPIYDWGYVTGTRRVVLDDFEGGFYGSNHFREEFAKKLEGKLLKGESVYYEVAGFTDTGVPIMPPTDLKKTKDKSLIKTYGDNMIWSYGCDPLGKDAPTAKMFVYRMTMTNEDGDVTEYTPTMVKHRCEQMGVDMVPVFGTFILGENAEKEVMELAEKFYNGPDPIDSRHIREGVVVRVLNRPNFVAYKHKNFTYKLLRNIVKSEIEVSADVDTDRLEEI